jgi:AcrR family transcriptional regulator
MTRRERQREATREEIKALARRQMADSGTASLSLTGIARAMELVPSALYRYYPDRDALITALILDAFESLALALRQASAIPAPDEYGERLLQASLAYRRWGLDNPIDFQLIFGNPIPGYTAPLQLTGEAMQRVFGTFLDIIEQAHEAGVLRPVSDVRPETLAPCPPDDAFAGYTPPVMYTGLSGWAILHGAVTLELFGFLTHSLADPEAFFRGHMIRHCIEIGLNPA